MFDLLLVTITTTMMAKHQVHAVYALRLLHLMVWSATPCKRSVTFGYNHSRIC